MLIWNDATTEIILVRVHLPFRFLCSAPCCGAAAIIWAPCRLHCYLGAHLLSVVWMNVWKEHTNEYACLATCSVHASYKLLALLTFLWAIGHQVRFGGSSLILKVSRKVEWHWGRHKVRQKAQRVLTFGQSYICSPFFFLKDVILLVFLHAGMLVFYWIDSTVCMFC